MLDRLSIRLRLVLLSITLVGITIGTNLYLTRALDRAAEAALVSDRIVSEIAAANEVRNAFADLRYWMTDLAVSLLTLSETNAEAARAMALLRDSQRERQRLAAEADRQRRTL